MLAPFAFLAPSFAPEAVGRQGLGIVVFFLALIVGDVWSARRRSFDSQRVKLPPKIVHMFQVLALVAVGLQAFHLAIMPTIPLLSKFAFGGKEISILREESSKLLLIPAYYKYLFQLTYTFLAPVCIFVFVSEKRWVSTGLLFSATLFYAAATAATQPGVIFFLIVIAMIWPLLPLFWRKQIVRSTVCIGAMVTILASAFLLFHPRSILKHLDFQVADEKLAPIEHLVPFKIDKVPAVTVIDRYRLYHHSPTYIVEKLWERKINGLFYRIIMTPVEVSHRWYHLFPVGGEHLGLYGLTAESRVRPGYRHPSNIVGLWAYYQRMPGAYLESVHAYGSIDADAYARWGVAGILVAALLVLLLRLGLGFFASLPGQNRFFARGALVILAMNLPMASLPAIFVAQGLGAYVILMATVWVGQRRWLRAAPSERSLERS